MKGPLKYLAVILLILVLLPVALFFISTDLLIPKYNRELQWARSSTEVKIWKYEMTGYSNELRRWIVERQDGGIGMEMAFTYLEWGLKNPEGFDGITSSIEPNKQKEVIEWLCQTIGRPSEQTRMFVESRNEPTFVEFRKCMWR